MQPAAADVSREHAILADVCATVLFSESLLSFNQQS